MCKKLFLLLITSAFLICVTCPYLLAESNAKKDAKQVQNAFIEVAQNVGPAVVSISTVHIQKVPAKRLYYYGPSRRGQAQPYSNEQYDDFFREFFEGTPQQFEQRGLGSGFIIDKQGYILTNAHVVIGADKITVTLSDGRRFQGHVKGIDERSDLAVIKVDATNLPVVELGDSNDVRIGQWVVAIGNPFGYAVQNPEPTVTVGVISALHRFLARTQARDRDYSDLIQTDAAINPGNSGGPLIDLDGKVIGINVAIFTTTGGYLGIGFAIPVNTAKEVMGSLIEGKKIVYGWLGIQAQNITDDIAKYFGLPTKEGALVAKSLEGSPAQKAGIKEGDIIKSLNGEKINNLQELLKKVGHSEVGKKIKIDVLRNKKELSFDVVVEERPLEGASQKASSGSISTKSSCWRGVKVVENNSENAKKLNLDTSKGVIVTEIDRQSLAYDSGLREADVILEINRAAINSILDYEKAVGAATGDCLVRTDKGFIVIKEEKKEDKESK